MPAAPVPDDDAWRLERLRRYAILDTLPEEAFDDLVHLAARACDAPLCAISFIDRDRQWLKASLGVPQSLPRAQAFCAYSIHDDATLVVQDARFADNPLVTGDAALRFYAGAPLVAEDGARLGTLCVLDTSPRVLTEAQRVMLEILARQVVAQLELRRRNAELAAALAERDAAERRLAMLHVLNEAVASALDVGDALYRVVKHVCTFLGWDAGGAWILEPGTSRLVQAGAYHVVDQTLEPFARASGSLVLQSGTGLPGRVLAEGVPVWMEEVAAVDRLPRAGVAAAVGLHSGVGVPVRLGDDVVAVLEIFCRRERGRDGAILDALVHAAASLGAALRRKATEDENLALVTRARAMAETLPDALVFADADGRILEWNPAAERMFGHSADSVLGEPLSRIIPPRLRDAHQQGMRRVAATGASRLAGRTVELMALRADGSEFPIEMSMATWEASGARAYGAVLRDISERKSAAAALQASQEAYRLLAEHASDIVFRGGPDAVLQWVSASVTAQLGWRPDAIVGHSIRELVHEEDVVRMLAASGGVNEGDVVSYEARFRRAGGDFRWMAVVARPVRDGEGRVIARIGSARDIHAEVGMRRRLAASEERYRLLADNVADVVVQSRAGVVVWVSPSVERSFGGSRVRWLGKALCDFVHPDDVGAFDVWVRDVPHRADARTRGRIAVDGGGWRWVDAHANAYIDADGAADGLVTSLRVVDAEVVAQQELERRARIDQLTGLLNSGEANRQVDTLLRGERRAGSEIAVLFCDVDKFKQINDTLGHAGGDAALRTIGGRIAAAVRSGDVAARMGGDEFMVVLREVLDLDAAVAVAEKLRASVRREMSVGERSVHLSLSIGVTLARPGEDIVAIAHRADVAMYRAKQHGRDQVVAIAFDDA